MLAIKEYKDLLSCNLNDTDFTDISESILKEENDIYFDGIKNDWNHVYGTVPSLAGWKSPGYEYPNIDPCHQKLMDVLKQKKPKSVCEVGAGAGKVSKYCYDLLGPDVKLTSVEGSPSHREQMKENFSKSSDIIAPQIKVVADIVEGVAQDLPLEDNSVELVYTCTVAMHIPFLMIPQAFKEFARVSSKYIVHVENINDKINAVVMGKQKSPLNKLCIDYKKMYELLGVKTLSYERFDDPIAPCQYICYVGEKM
jgi:SAM-dependent methyltransferase|tara:strand:- start:3096 stop:3857 length:762 start_codon:yes stop_codon:yes gene_type:complete